MSSTEAFNEIIQPLVSLCSPLRIKIKLKVIKGRYYIHFDGSNTYDDPAKWDIFWTGFEKHVAHLLSLHKIEYKSIKSKSNCYAIAYLGTLFCILKQ